MPDGSGVGRALADTLESGTKAVASEGKKTIQTFTSQLGLSQKTPEQIAAEEQQLKGRVARLHQEVMSQTRLQKEAKPIEDKVDKTLSSPSIDMKKSKTTPLALKQAQTKIENGRQTKS